MAVDLRANQPEFQQNSGESQPQPPTLDPKVLANLRRLQRPGDPSFLASLIERYLADTPLRLATLREAIVADDADALQQIAHLLRGNSANLGARQLSGLCRELDTLGRSGSTTGGLAWFAAIEEEFLRVKTALEAEALQAEHEAMRNED